MAGMQEPGMRKKALRWLGSKLHPLPQRTLSEHDEIMRYREAEARKKLKKKKKKKPQMANNSY